MRVKEKRDAPPAASMEMRIAMLELAVRDLTSALNGLKAIREGRVRVPTMPDGSGTALAVARAKAGWRNRDLAVAIGVSPSMLSLWECERMAIPMWRADAILTIFQDAGVEPPEWGEE